MSQNNLRLKFAPKDAPLIRNGCWTWYISSLKEPLLAEIAMKGKELQEKLMKLMNGQTTKIETNPQALWEIFKSNLKKIARQKVPYSVLKGLRKTERKYVTIPILSMMKKREQRKHI